MTHAALMDFILAPTVNYHTPIETGCSVLWERDNATAAAGQIRYLVLERSPVIGKKDKYRVGIAEK